MVVVVQESAVNQLRSLLKEGEKYRVVYRRRTNDGRPPRAAKYILLEMVAIYEKPYYKQFVFSVSLAEEVKVYGEDIVEIYTTDLTKRKPRRIPLESRIF